MTTKALRVAAMAFGLAAAMSACGSRGPQEVAVQVTDAGFVPPVVDVPRGRPVVVTFTRTIDKTCATDVVFKGINRGYDLPLDKPVQVTLSPTDSGDTLKYSCSMDMVRGMLVAK